MSGNRIIVGISGASGTVIAIRLLEALRMAGVETHLVVSRAADLTRALETRMSAAELRALADVSYNAQDVGAAIASGSFKTRGMIVAPCSMRCLAEIATGNSSSLLTRAADVVLKERRKLVLVARETPLHLVHLRNMVAVTEMGGIIFPPVPAFYSAPQDLADMVDHLVGRMLDLFDIEVGLVRRWRDSSISQPNVLQNVVSTAGGNATELVTNTQNHEGKVL